jgi:hydrogenase nickel incorporation protein HypB
MKVIELKKSVTDSNDRDAALLRRELDEKGMLLINLMSAAGSGKTTFLSRTITDLKDLRIAVIEADIESVVDAERIAKLGARSIQAHTDGMCHMDAGMTREAVESIGTDETDVLFLENIGNLICPAEYDTGAQRNVMILSVPEGDDKPLKYPLMFEVAHAVAVTKLDVTEIFDFSTERAVENIRKRNSGAEIFFTSSVKGDGIDALAQYIKNKAFKKIRKD